MTAAGDGEMAGGSSPEMTLDDFMNWVRGFVDLLVLACGYQSWGKHAVWHANNIKKTMHWGIFFENVSTSIRLFDTFRKTQPCADQWLYFNEKKKIVRFDF